MKCRSRSQNYVSALYKRRSPGQQRPVCINDIRLLMEL